MVLTVAVLALGLGAAHPALAQRRLPPPPSAAATPGSVPAGGGASSSPAATGSTSPSAVQALPVVPATPQASTAGGPAEPGPANPGAANPGAATAPARLNTGLVTIESDLQRADQATGVVTATGNVRIVYPDQRVVATARQAQYFSKEGRLVLSGDVDIVQEGGNLLRAERVVYLVESERLTAIPPEGQQVFSRMRMQPSPAAATAPAAANRSAEPMTPAAVPRPVEPTTPALTSGSPATP